MYSVRVELMNQAGHFLKRHACFTTRSSTLHGKPMNGTLTQKAHKQRIEYTKPGSLLFAYFLFALECLMFVIFAEVLVVS